MMKQHKRVFLDFAYAAVILVTAFALNLALLQWFSIPSVTPMVFVLGVFLIAWRTQGYFWGIASSLVSVMAVNYAFTYPYWAFNLIRPECLASAVVMLMVSIMTSTMTTQIKRQEQMKAEAEKERMRGNLLRAVSHDLRTPLTSIYGACSAMLENYDALPRQTHIKLLSDVCADAQWLVRMVENLLSVTRVDTSTVRLSKNDTVLEELIDAVLVKFHKHYPDTEVHVEIPEEFVSIPMDAMLISQVLMNLLENAVFHAKGMENLRLRVEVKGSWAYFYVEDDGCGLPTGENWMENRRRFLGGVQAGLLLCRRYCAHMGWVLSLTPRDAGSGTRAEVRIPLAGTMFPIEGSVELHTIHPALTTADGLRWQILRELALLSDKME